MWSVEEKLEILYSYLRGIRLKGDKNTYKYSDIDSYYNEVNEKMNTFQDYHKKYWKTR